DAVVFLAYSRSGLTLDNLLRDGIPADPAAARSFFEYTLAPAAPPDGTLVASLDATADAPAAVWRFLRLHHYDTSPIAARYLDFLLCFFCWKNLTWPFWWRKSSTRSGPCCRQDPALESHTPSPMSGFPAPAAGPGDGFRRPPIRHRQS